MSKNPKDEFKDFAKGLAGKWLESGLQIKNLAEAFLTQYKDIPALLQQLDKLKTWAKDGKEMLQSHEQVQKVLGHEKVKAIAAKMNMTQEQVTAMVMEYLPKILTFVDNLKKKATSTEADTKKKDS